MTRPFDSNVDLTRLMVGTGFVHDGVCFRVMRLALELDDRDDGRSSFGANLQSGAEPTLV